MNQGDYVIALTDYENVKKNSVGLIMDIDDVFATVYFIGIKENVLVLLEDISYLDIKKTGKPYNVKVCNVCHILKSNDDFDINQTDALGRKTTRPSCRDCRLIIDGAKMPVSEHRRLNKVKPKDIFTCPICGKTSIVGVTANLVKDHDHVRGRGRDWICDSCNTGLGRFKDSIDLLQRAIDYLRKHGGE